MAAQLRTARQRAGLSLAEVSKRSGLDRAAISRLENGMRDNPTLATLGRYAHALGLRILVSLVHRERILQDSTRRRQLGAGCSEIHFLRSIAFDDGSHPLRKK